MQNCVKLKEDVEFKYDLMDFFYRFDQYVKNADPSEVDLNKPFGIGRG